MAKSWGEEVLLALKDDDGDAITRAFAMPGADLSTQVVRTPYTCAVVSGRTRGIGGWGVRLSVDAEDDVERRCCEADGVVCVVLCCVACVMMVAAMAGGRAGLAGVGCGGTRGLGRRRK